VHPAEEGLEVGAPSRSRGSQVGLIVVSGPRIVSPEDKLGPKSGYKSWNSGSSKDQEYNAVMTQATQKDDTAQAELIKTTKKKIWGFRKKTLQILVAIAILIFAGIIVGVSVGLTQRKGLE
jgi:hypothetical protein